MSHLYTYHAPILDGYLIIAALDDDHAQELVDNFTRERKLPQTIVTRIWGIVPGTKCYVVPHTKIEVIIG